MRRAVIQATICMAFFNAAGAPHAQPAGSKAQVQAVIWDKERAIYAGRGRGDLAPYIGTAASAFQSWPPQAATPLDLDQLRASAAQMAHSREKLEMTFVSMALDGDVAVIYYRTHMTVRADGSPTDQSYEVTHTWIDESGAWRLLGGMARLVAKP